MTMATDTEPVAKTGTLDPAIRADRFVVAWLSACAALVAFMMLVGAITRLTESGLSIAEWAPIIGTLPPLSDGEWQRVFALYRETLEYQTVNAGMSLADFKTIFWWEYLHRLLGRFIGLAFGLPLAWFAIRRRISVRLGVRLGAIFLLGGLQGGVGWWMVQSGLVDRVDVSQYRLATHLIIAFLILGAMVWTLLDLLPTPQARRSPSTAQVRFSMALMALVFVLLFSGGLVAGLDAGFVYNDWPLMNGTFVPSAYGAISPWWLNTFENVAAVQFNHRMLAYAVAVAVVILWAMAWRGGLAGRIRLPLDLLLAMTGVQILLGIATVVSAVPLSLGIAHQAGAIALFCLTLWTVHTLAHQRR